VSLLDAMHRLDRVRYVVRSARTSHTYHNFVDLLLVVGEAAWSHVLQGVDWVVIGGLRLALLGLRPIARHDSGCKRTPARICSLNSGRSHSQYQFHRHVQRTLSALGDAACEQIEQQTTENLEHESNEVSGT
jgi:hypothetical protein